MNSLSWMLYWAGVANNLQGLFMAFAMISGFGTIACWIFGSGDYGNSSLLKWPKFTIPFAIVFGILAALMPNQNTIYAIAASELGEEVLKSDTATKAQKALDAWLDKQIDQQPEKQ